MPGFLGKSRSSRNIPFGMIDKSVEQQDQQRTTPFGMMDKSVESQEQHGDQKRDGIV